MLGDQFHLLLFSEQCHYLLRADSPMYLCSADCSICLHLQHLRSLSEIEMMRKYKVTRERIRINYTDLMFWVFRLIHQLQRCRRGEMTTAPLASAVAVSSCSCSFLLRTRTERSD